MDDDSHIFSQPALSSAVWLPVSVDMKRILIFFQPHLSFCPALVVMESTDQFMGFGLIISRMADHSGFYREMDLGSEHFESFRRSLILWRQ